MRHIKRFDEIVNEAVAVDSLFVCGYMEVGPNGTEKSKLWISSSLEGAKTIALGWMDGLMKQFDTRETGMTDYTVCCFICSQGLNRELTAFDPNGGTMGEIMVTGRSKPVFMFNEDSPSDDAVESAIQELTALK